MHKITSKRLPDDKGLAIVDEDSPYTERNFKVKRDVLASLRCYSKILKKRKYESIQRSMNSCFKTTMEM